MKALLIPYDWDFDSQSSIKMDVPDEDFPDLVERLADEIGEQGTENAAHIVINLETNRSALIITDHQLLAMVESRMDSDDDEDEETEELHEALAAVTQERDELRARLGLPPVTDE